MITNFDFPKVYQSRTWWSEGLKKAADCVCKEWKPIRTALFQVLSLFPDARAAVLEKLREMDEGQLPTLST